MRERPSLLDNRTKATDHGDGLSYLARDLEDRHSLSVATGYVNLGGLRHLAVVSEGRQRKTRLLLGAAPPNFGAEIPATLFQRTLLALCKERDLSRFPPSRALEDLSAVEHWLQQDDVEVRRYVRNFLHGKAYLFGDDSDARAALVTSANLTGAGMWQNLELGLVHYDPVVARRAVQWFDQLWQNAEDYKADLCRLLFPDPELVDPRTIYLRALLDLFGDDRSQGNSPAGAGHPSTLSLAPFQEDGFQRALAIVRKHSGVVYADGVGTGKTEIGLAFAEEYAVRRGQHVLIVVPAQLRKHWNDRLKQTRLPAEVLSYHEFASDEQLADPDVGYGARGQTKRVLSNDKDVYRLVIFDEAHALRNPNTTWYRAMSRLLGGPQKDLVLLTATPVNNGLWDLYHLVMAFARHEEAFAPYGIRSLRRLFERAGANERTPEDLDPSVLFELADMVSVRRDRRFILSEYADAVFPDGTPVAFPTPNLATERYDLDQAHAGLVQYIAKRIDGLTMARYVPSRYHRSRGLRSSEVTVSGLLRSAVLKRLESCWHACLLTAGRMLEAHHIFLKAWDHGWVPDARTLLDLRVDLDETGLAQKLGEAIDEEASGGPAFGGLGPGRQGEPAANFDPRFRDDVASDARRLEEITHRLSRLSPAEDPKLALLRRILSRSESQKIAVFSTFADTVRYLNEHLPDPVSGRKRIAVIGGDTTPDQRTDMLSRFCPESVVRPGYCPLDGEVDLLISNDVLSEGQNLQQAAAVVSYDIPWNPQRMVQRYGRVIRLRSPHADVRLTTMLPKPGDLEVILKLEGTIRRKIVAAGTYGMEVPVVDNAGDQAIRAYAARLARGDLTLLDDAEGGGADGPYSEALRAELRRELEEGRDAELRALPWGTGAAFCQGPGVPSAGAPGVFFASRAKGERYWRYVDANGVIAEPAAILRRIDPGHAPGADQPAIDLESAWDQAATSIVDAHNEEVAAGAKSPSVGPAQRWALDVLANPAVRLPPGSNEAYAALQVGRSQPVRRALNDIRRQVDAEEISNHDAAQQIVHLARRFGLRPVEKAPERDRITKSDIGVVCWMAVREAG